MRVNSSFIWACAIHHRTGKMEGWIYQLKGSAFFLSLSLPLSFSLPSFYIYIYIFYIRIEKIWRRSKATAAIAGFPHDHSAAAAAAAAAHLWMRIMTNYGLVKEKRGERGKVLQILYRREEEKKRRTSYKELWRWQDLTSLCVCVYIPICIPNPPKPHRRGVR